MKKPVKVLIVVVLGASVGLGAFYYLNTPSDGVINEPQARKRSVLESADSISLEGRFMSLTYPGIYLHRALPVSAPDLEIHQLTAGTNYKKQLTISVSELPDGKLNNNSAYLLRQSQPNVYTKRIENISEKQVEVWERSDKTEQTAFLVDGERAVIIAAVQEGGDKAALEQELRTILVSFSWK